MTFGEKWRKFWYFLSEDNSVWSWIANIVIAFVLIKFIVYPGLGLIAGTQYPVVAVVSGSMEHNAEFNSWWSSECCKNTACTVTFPQSEFYEQKGLKKDVFLSIPFPNGFNKGDIMVLKSPKDIKVGDVIVFIAENRYDPIIHRVVEANNKFSTKGDNNCYQATFDKEISPDRVVGRAVFRIPLLGWVKVGAVAFLEQFKGVLNAVLS